VNNFIKIILVILLVFGAYSWNDNRVSETKDDWINYSFNNENINVMFPANPKIETALSMGIDVKLVKVKKFKNKYIVGLTKGIDEFSDETFYPFSLVKKGATIKTSKQISVDGFIGKEFYMDFNGKESIMRFIKYNDFLITQLAIYKKENKEKGEIDKFFKSLNINKERIN
jgi:hypothetical protein